MERENVVSLLKEHKVHMAKHFNVSKIGLFGSYVRNEQTNDSDIDILVEFMQPVGFEFIELKYYLESIFQRPVDLVTVNALKSYMKEEVLSEVQYQ